MKITFCSHPIELLPSGALFFTHKKYLVVADLHLGKIIAMKDQGIPGPSFSDFPTIVTLFNDLSEKKPDGLILLGDIFHQYSNHIQPLLNWFYNELNQYGIPVYVTLGNHDQHLIPSIDTPHISFVHDFNWNSILFCHEPRYDQPCIAGHIHPGIKLKKGKLPLYYKAFVIKNDLMVLPAYGKLTGITPQKIDYDTCYIIDNDHVTLFNAFS